MSDEDRRSVLSNIERRYGIAGRAAGEAALQFGAGRKATDAFVCSRIARAVVDALAADDQGAVGALERIAAIEVETPLLHSSEAARLRNAVAIAAAALDALRGRCE